MPYLERLHQTLINVNLILLGYRKWVISINFVDFFNPQKLFVFLHLKQLLWHTYMCSQAVSQISMVPDSRVICNQLCNLPSF